MKIPKSVSIFGQKYKVKLLKAVNSDGDKCCGLIDPETKTIYIDKTMTIEKQLHTFFHEVIHAVLNETGCGHSLSILEEPIVDNVSKCMAELFLKI